MITLIAGARPNFMKIAPLIHALQAAQQSGADISYRLVHTGQHFDDNMSAVFFREMGSNALTVGAASCSPQFFSGVFFSPSQRASCSLEVIIPSLFTVAIFLLLDLKVTLVVFVLPG